MATLRVRPSALDILGVDLFKKTNKTAQRLWASAKSLTRDRKRSEFKARVLSDFASPLILPNHEQTNRRP